MSMISDIVNGLMKELKTYFLSGGTCILDTELTDDFTVQGFPLCVVELSDAPESARLPGTG